MLLRALIVLLAVSGSSCGPTYTRVSCPGFAATISVANEVVAANGTLCVPGREGLVLFTPPACSDCQTWCGYGCAAL